jgi:hypothetical protein
MTRGTCGVALCLWLGLTPELAAQRDASDTAASPAADWLFSAAVTNSRKWEQDFDLGARRTGRRLGLGAHYVSRQRAVRSVGSSVTRHEGYDLLALTVTRARRSRILGIQFALGPGLARHRYANFDESYSAGRITYATVLDAQLTWWASPHLGLIAKGTLIFHEPQGRYFGGPILPSEDNVALGVAYSPTPRR